MKTCTFFGHRDTREEIGKRLSREIERLIIEEGVRLFYVGNQGNFDTMVRKLLEKYKLEFPHIEFFVVTAYPRVKNKELSRHHIYPLSVKSIPERNIWMIENSDFVVTYVTSLCGGAARFKRYAFKQKKTVIELTDIRT